MSMLAPHEARQLADTYKKLASQYRCIAEKRPKDSKQYQMLSFIAESQEKRANRLYASALEDTLKQAEAYKLQQSLDIAE